MINNTFQLPENKEVEIKLNSNGIMDVFLIDNDLNKTIRLGSWSKMGWDLNNFFENELFELTKQFPQLKRLIHHFQSYKEETPFELQFKCFKRKFKLLIHKITHHG